MKIKHTMRLKDWEECNLKQRIVRSIIVGVGIVLILALLKRFMPMMWKGLYILTEYII